MNSMQTMLEDDNGLIEGDPGSPGTKRKVVDTIMNQLLDSVALTARPVLVSTRRVYGSKDNME